MQTQQRYTPEEYLSREDLAEQRHEYRNGDIIPMVGGTPNHNRILLNLATALHFNLKRQPFQVFAADQKLWIPDSNRYTYPDVMVVAGDLQLQPGRKDTVLNPALIVEILSESTQAYDRGDKFKTYRRLESLQEYILIDQYSVYVEQYSKQSRRDWKFIDYEDINAELNFESLPLAVSLLDIYDQVRFESEQPN